MEKRFQQLFESTIKVLISMITLRPIVRRLFSFKGAFSILIAISAFRIMDALVNAAGSVNLFGLFDLPREVVGWLYAIINILITLHLSQSLFSSDGYFRHTKAMKLSAP